ncbi:hypothetical protein [Actinocrispum sp. NPDC049592]|uniref:hypothetical protein n=1 Tax=Actinocrispum sp. NPDC049592 TaxID=3154835 RepID=UPI00341F2BE1
MGGDLVHLAMTGVPVVAVLGYVLMRVADRIMFLVGLRMVLRNTREEDRVAAIKAYRDTPRRGRVPADPPDQPC